MLPIWTILVGVFSLTARAAGRAGKSAPAGEGKTPGLRRREAPVFDTRGSVVTCSYDAGLPNRWDCSGTVVTFVYDSQRVSHRLPENA